MYKNTSKNQIIKITLSFKVHVGQHPPMNIARIVVDFLKKE